MTDRFNCSDDPFVSICWSLRWHSDTLYKVHSPTSDPALGSSCKTQFSEPQWHVSYDFKRIKSGLNVHTDVTDRAKSHMLPIQVITASALPHQVHLLSLHSVPFNNYWSSIYHARPIQKAFTFYFTLRSTQLTVSHIQSKEIITPR